jgi:hypothetical protein
VRAIYTTTTRQTTAHHAHHTTHVTSLTSHTPSIPRNLLADLEMELCGHTRDSGGVASIASTTLTPAATEEEGGRRGREGAVQCRDRAEERGEGKGKGKAEGEGGGRKSARKRPRPRKRGAAKPAAAHG